MIHADIELDYCDDPEIPHFLVIEFAENSTYVPNLADIPLIIDEFNKEAPQFLNKHSINTVPTIHLIVYAI